MVLCVLYKRCTSDNTVSRVWNFAPTLAASFYIENNIEVNNIKELCHTVVSESTTQFLHRSFKTNNTYLQQPQRRVWSHQHIHAALHNTRLLHGNLVDRIAQNLLMIELHRCNHRQCHIRSGKYIRCVLSAAQPSFQYHHVAACALEFEHGEAGGELEEGRGHAVLDAGVEQFGQNRL